MIVVVRWTLSVDLQYASRGYRFFVTRIQQQQQQLFLRILCIRWLGGLLVERLTSVSQIRGSIPRQVAAV